MTTSKQQNEEQPKRRGLMLCCMRTAEREYELVRGDIAPGTVIQCRKCGRAIEHIGGGWKAHEAE